MIFIALVHFHLHNFNLRILSLIQVLMACIFRWLLSKCILFPHAGCHRMFFFMITDGHFHPRVCENLKKLFSLGYFRPRVWKPKKKFFVFNWLLPATCVKTKFLFFNWIFARNLIVGGQTAWAPCNAFYFKLQVWSKGMYYHYNSGQPRWNFRLYF